MATPPLARTFAALLLVASLSGGSCKSASKGKDFCFSFNGSEKNCSFGSDFALYGDAEMSCSAVRITRPGNSSSGGMAYRKAIRIFGETPGFSSSFSFSIPRAGVGGLAFFLSSSGVRLEPAEVDWLGLSTSLVAVRFGTSTQDKLGNLSRSLIAIDISGELLVTSSDHSDVDLVLNSGKSLLSWIDYDGGSKRIQVRLILDNDSMLTSSLISYSIDLSKLLLREAIFVGLSSWNSNSTESSSVYSWNFTAKHGAPYLMHSEPLDPNSFLVRPMESPSVHTRRAYPWGILMAMVLAATCGAVLTFLMMFVWVALVSRRQPVAPVEYPVEPVDVTYGKIEGEKSTENGKK